MKLLILTVMPSPYQRQLFAALAALPDINLQVFYFTAGAHDREWDIPDMAPFERILPGRTLRRISNSAHWNPGVTAEIEAFRPDLVVVSSYSALTAQRAMRYLNWRKMPWVFWGEMPGFSQRGTLGQIARNALQAPLRKARAIVGIGKVAERAYADLFPHLDIYNIPYYCDLIPYRQAAATADRKPATTDILFSGQMIPRKGVDVLLEAFRKIAPDHPHLRLLLLGGGPDQPIYEAQVPADLKSRVVFLGHKDPSELPAIFARAHVFCLPSRHDGWGVVVNEALGAGLPIVISDAVGAGGDLVEEGRNGFITPAGDSAALAAALAQLADPDVHARMSAAAREISLDWDVEQGARLWRKTALAVLNHSKEEAGPQHA